MSRQLRKIPRDISTQRDPEITPTRYQSTAASVQSILLKKEDFCSRHVGPRAKDQQDMLDYLGLKVRTKLGERLPEVSYFNLSTVRDDSPPIVHEPNPIITVLFGIGA